MKPFFSYYGSKYRLCQQGFYPKPIGEIVVEPFAGSATYSVFHDVEMAILIDKNPTIIGVWNYLISALEKDILDLPDNLGDFESLLEIKKYFPDSAVDLIGFWVGRGKTTPVHNVTKWWKQYHQDHCARVWNKYAKERITKQLPKIRKWQAYVGDYTLSQSLEINTQNATLFVDPPYSGPGGRKYQHNKINYQNLEHWLKEAQFKQKIACENEELAFPWADFNKARKAFNMRGFKQELAYVS